MRLVYFLGDMLPLLKNSNVALIGDGESKLKYIFNRQKLLTIAINRAAAVYPADFCATVWAHGEDIFAVTPAYMPLLVLRNTDVRQFDLKVSRSGTGVFLLEFLVKQAVNKIYLQGFDLSRSVYENQIDGFKRIGLQHPNKIFLMHGSQHLDFKVINPSPGEIL